MLKQSGNDDKMAVAAHLAISVYEKIEEKITGIAYSKDEKEYLRALKDIYKAALKTEPPVLWNLDEKDHPTHRIKTSDVALHIEQLRHDKSSLGPFHYYIDGVLEFAATYLKERGERGVLTRGKPGDVLEQFLTEFINWAINDLPTYTANSESVLRLRQRIDYLDRILKAENLFKFGTFARNKNKTETINNLKLTLEACLRYAEHEAERLNARDKLVVLKQETERLLLGCVNTLYYVRATPVQSEPLRLELFTHPTTATEHLSRLYNAVQSTHTGAMLREAIQIAGIESFGGSAESKAIAETHDYFNAQGQRQTIAWLTRKMDAPPWVSAEGAQPFVTQLHCLSEVAVRVAKLKNLIESAYDLTGKAGDLWAYGDEQGKASLEALLHLLGTELEQLMRLLRTLHSEHNAARHHYNMSRRLDQDKGVNPNFNKFDHHFAHCIESETRLNAAMADIGRQMRVFPVDITKRVNEQKQRFYHDLAAYITLYHPSVASRFPNLVPTGDSKEHIGTQAEVMATVVSAVPTTGTVSPSVSLFGTEGSLRLPVKKIGDLLILQQDIFQAYVPTTETLPFKSWAVGDDYGVWANGFMTRQAMIIVRYQETTDRLLAMKSPSEAKSIEQFGEVAKKDLTTLQQQLENTRPKWRFHLSWWPIQTAGWPFNRSARAFAEALSDLLKNTLTELKQRLAFMQATMTITNSAIAIPITGAPSSTDNKLLVRLPARTMTSSLSASERTTPGAETSSDRPLVTQVETSIAPLPTIALSPLPSAYELTRRTEEKAEKELEAYIDAKNDATEQKRFISCFIKELNREFEDPSQTHFERMQIDLRRERVFRLLAVETLSPVMQRACQEILPSLDARCEAPTLKLSTFYRRQAALVKCLLTVCTADPSVKVEARKACLREFEAYGLSQSTQALVIRTGGAALSGTALTSSPERLDRLPQLP